MTELLLYDKKISKRITDEFIELDLNDLEIYSHFKHGEEFLKIPSMIIGSKSIIEWFTVGDLSYWWFIAPMIHGKFKSATMFLDRLDSVVKQHSINAISLHGCFDKIHLIENFCLLKKINLKISSKYYSKKFNNFAKSLVKESAYKKINSKKFEKRINCIKPYQNSFKNEIGSTIITSPGIYRRNAFDLKNNVAKKGEFVLQPILEYFTEKKYPIICFDLDYTFRGTTDVLKERLSTKYNWQPIEVLLQGKKESIAKTTILELKKQFDNFKKNNLDSVFMYKGISLWKFLEPTFMEIFYEPNLPTYVDLTIKLEQFLAKIKPKQIIQLYETGPYAKAFEIASQKLGIKTFGLQHGMIPYDNADYVFKEVKSEKFPFGCFIPETTFVFGEYHKKILTEKGSYPKEKVISLGHPSYFNLEKIHKSLTQSNLLKKYSLPNKKIILVPLSFRFTYVKNSPDRVFLNFLFEKFKNNDNTIILVRPHPGDNFDQKLLEKLYPAKNFKISKATLVEDLILCDVVLALPISTITTEAVLFKKPVILANMTTQNSNSEFDKVYHELINYKVASLVNLDEIALTIDSIKKENLEPVETSENRNNFLKLFFNYGNTINFDKYFQ